MTRTPTRPILVAAAVLALVAGAAPAAADPTDVPAPVVEDTAAPTPAGDGAVPTAAPAPDKTGEDYARKRAIIDALQLQKAQQQQIAAQAYASKQAEQLANQRVAAAAPVDRCGR